MTVRTKDSKKREDPAWHAWWMTLIMSQGRTEADARDWIADGRVICWCPYHFFVEDIITTERGALTLRFGATERTLEEMFGLAQPRRTLGTAAADRRRERDSLRQALDAVAVVEGTFPAGAPPHLGEPAAAEAEVARLQIQLAEAQAMVAVLQCVCFLTFYSLVLSFSRVFHSNSVAEIPTLV